MRLIIFAILAYLLYRILRGFFSSGQKLRNTKKNGIIDEMVKDPFCNTYIPQRDAKKKIIDGKEYFFCCEECAHKFQKDRLKEEL
jgi:YHS domain-containing protein